MRIGPLTSACALALVLVACTEPHFTNGGFACATTIPMCPDGFHCALDGRCWSNGQEPDLAGLDLAGRDFSSPDLATTSVDLAGVDLVGNPSLCAGLNVLLCDGFEGALNTTRWIDASSNGSATVDTTRAYRGASSLHLHTNLTATAGARVGGSLNTYQGLPLNGTIYLRMYMFVPSTTPTGFEDFIDFTNDSGSGGVSWSMQNGNWLLNAWNAGPFQQSATMVPLDQWFCVQLQLAQNGAATGPVSFAVNNSTVSDLSLNATLPNPQPNKFFVGQMWEGNPANLPASDLWIDEIILDNKPISCSE
jgi:hypothetical protein